MRTQIHLLAMGLTVAILLAPAWGQPPGGDRGSRGGFGGGFPGGGGPGGGFPGGGFPGRGGPGGGEGGFPSRGGGGDRGGDRGGRGGEGGGGFNPADMLKRFDRNGNNMIDPEEAQGPAQFFLQRLAQNNPKIDLKKPVPIDQLTSEMDRMRGGGGGDRDSGGGSSSSNEPELLVPNFALATEALPPEGFGAGSSVFNVKVEERDLKEAEDRMRRYDSNKDGVLSTEELKAGRWGDDPLQYDRNRDGKLSKTEMAMRYANRRVADEERRSSSNDSRSRGGWASRGDNGGWGRGENREENSAAETVNRFGDAKSYRSSSSGGTKVDGLPDFFARSDADGDGQVQMNEFSSEWNQETLEEFLKWDLNQDGIIIAQECLTALANGVRVDGGSSSASASAPSSSSSSPSASSSSSGDAQLDWAKRQIGKYDSNGDGQLTANEWNKMIIKPVGADGNGDGVLTAQEYAEFRAKK